MTFIFEVVLTTRLHGMVLALKTAFLSLRSIRNPAEQRSHVKPKRSVGHSRFAVDTIDDELLTNALEHCLTTDARLAARRCFEQAAKASEDMKSEFITALTKVTLPSAKSYEREVLAKSSGLHDSSRSTTTATLVFGQLKRGAKLLFRVAKRVRGRKN
jgi:hypothetical protein